MAAVFFPPRVGDSPLSIFAPTPPLLNNLRGILALDVPRGCGTPVATTVRKHDWGLAVLYGGWEGILYNCGCPFTLQAFWRYFLPMLGTGFMPTRPAQPANLSFLIFELRIPLPIPLYRAVWP
ncbi:hypothetical protein DQ04_08211040 [Trypanosoma grayi]|uniref:hypothetical protein n=1 Tax=Trypanosoma grayi TaxID=71804 RepID=UPI0004F46C94|nr:hypothetical protein DQ04_08211040 [Trypanosoma grayi]KEG08015.1 hypothetical protein DQ04_08211040 [Trypanosoma grayi]